MDAVDILEGNIFNSVINNHFLNAKFVLIQVLLTSLPQLSHHFAALFFSLNIHTNV